MAGKDSIESGSVRGPLEPSKSCFAFEGNSGLHPFLTSNGAVFMHGSAPGHIVGKPGLPLKNAPVKREKWWEGKTHGGKDDAVCSLDLRGFSIAVLLYNKADLRSDFDEFV